MAKTFVYQVYNSGYEFRGDSAWGQAWKDAKAKAIELHTGIMRTVEQDGKEPRHEYYAKGSVFLNIKFYPGPHDLHIFEERGFYPSSLL